MQLFLSLRCYCGFQVEQPRQWMQVVLTAIQAGVIAHLLLAVKALPISPPLLERRGVAAAGSAVGRAIKPVTPQPATAAVEAGGQRLLKLHQELGLELRQMRRCLRAVIIGVLGRGWRAGRGCGIRLLREFLQRRENSDKDWAGVIGDGRCSCTAADRMNQNSGIGMRGCN